MISELRIKNFKSIKNIFLKPKKVNLIIGKPNVGKSNLLEALGLLSIPDYIESHKSMKDGPWRFRRLSEFFRKLDEEIEIKTKQHSIELNYSKNGCRGELTTFEYSSESSSVGSFSSFVIQEGGALKYEKGNLDQSDVLFYKYSDSKSFDSRQNLLSLEQPSGDNLFAILFSKQHLVDEFQSLLNDFGFNLIYLQEEERFVIQKEVRSNFARQLHFDLLADTFKRYLFLLAAIKSNSNRTIIFEEPETHSFPEYIGSFASEVSNDETNQFFIVTHSPYLYDQLISDVPAKDLRVFHIDFKEGQTVANPLKHDNIIEMNRQAMDVFYNMDNLL